MWSQLEPTPAHLTYLSLSLFLMLYALFAQFIRNHLHLSEPPLAVAFGILLGPSFLNILRPRKFGIDDSVIQEFTRMVVGIQCFAVGVELPRGYFSRHGRSVAMMLGPVMLVSWLVTSALVSLIFGVAVPTALIIGACLSPTDPVLAASVLSKSRFSERVPRHLRNLLAAESASNDGASYPFLYAGLVLFTQHSPLAAMQYWLLNVIVYQCVLGLLLGLALGYLTNKALRAAYSNEYPERSSFIVFYLLLAILAVGVGSTLNVDGFLVALGAGVGFSEGGYFANHPSKAKFPSLIDLLLNSTIFVFFGADVPWAAFKSCEIAPSVNYRTLGIFFALILVLRRIPVVLALRRFIPDVKTYREALFLGHFGPMGVGALFLAVESRARLETGRSVPEPQPPIHTKPYSDRAIAEEVVWPIVCFVVLGSTIVHGLSVGVISISGKLTTIEGERVPLIRGVVERLDCMVYEDETEDELEDEEF
jgi:NhaP-type Na+/H+ or K+/H+ antiporter